LTAPDIEQPDLGAFVNPSAGYSTPIELADVFRCGEKIPRRKNGRRTRQNPAYPEACAGK
jgi:hypothetical protein